jgi:hypothetical protein
VSSSARACAVRSDTSPDVTGGDAAGPDAACARGVPSSRAASKRHAAHSGIDMNPIAPTPQRPIRCHSYWRCGFPRRGAIPDGTSAARTAERPGRRMVWVPADRCNGLALGDAWVSSTRRVRRSVPLIVMVGEGPPSMSCGAGLGTRRGWRARAHHDGIKRPRPDLNGYFRAFS